MALLILGGVLLAPVAWAQQPATRAPKPAGDEYHREQEYLLHNDWPNLRRYATANQRLLAPKPGVPRVVLLGSITEGWPKSDPAFFGSEPYAYIGRGIGGQPSGQTVLRFRQDVVGLRPAVVVLLIGTNDVAENNGPYCPQVTMDNIATMVELAQVHRIRVVLCSVPPTADFWWHRGLNPAPKIVALNKRISTYAGQHGCVYLASNKV